MGNQSEKEQRITSYLLSEMLRTQACLEFAAASLYFNAYSSLLAQGAAPEITRKALELAKEEIHHFILFRDLHESRWGELDSLVARRVKAMALPSIENEADFFAARWIVDGTGLLQMRAYTGTGWPAYKKAIGVAVRDESRHMGEGKRAFVSAARSAPNQMKRQFAQYAKKWLGVGLLGLGSPGTAFDKLAVRLNLKKKSGEELRQLLEKEVMGTLMALGLRE